MKRLNDDQVDRLQACLNRGWGVSSFFLHDLDTRDELEEALRITDLIDKGDVINSYMRDTLREIHQLWPNPEDLFDQSFATKYPLISQTLSTPGKMRTYLNVVRFANASVNYYSQLISGILKEHAAGADYVERERCRDYDCEPRYNTDCWIYATMASYPAMECIAAHEILMPDAQGCRVAGAQNIHYWEWSKHLLAINKHDGPLEIDIYGHGKIEVCDKTGYLNSLWALLCWACELMSVTRYSGYSQWALIEYSKERNLLRVAQSSTFFDRVGPDEVLISYEDQPPAVLTLQANENFGQALKRWAIESELPHSSEYASGYEITSVNDQIGISVRRNPHVKLY